MISAIQEALVWADPVATFFFLIFTVSHTLPYREFHRLPVPRWLSIAGGVAAFLVIFKPMEAHNSHFMAYWLTMAVMGLVYTFVFTVAQHALQITTCITYLSWITLTKSTVGAVLAILGLSDRISQESIVFYLFFFLLLTAASLFMQRHCLVVLQDFPMRYWICMIVTPMVISFAANLFLSTEDVSSASALVQSVFILLFFISLMVYYLSYAITTTNNNLTESRLTNQILSLQVSHTERSSAMVEQIHRDKHEMKNVYFYIQSLIKSGQIRELEEFVDTKLVHRFDAYEEYHTGNQLVDYLLEQKVSEARADGISVMTNVFLPEQLSIADTDLCGLLLNLVNNAIDASRKEEKGDIHITIRQVKSYLMIEVRNRCSRNVLAANPTLSTTKKDRANHGYGLKIVDSIIKKYEGVKDVHMESDYFVVNAMLRNSMSKEAA